MDVIDFGNEKLKRGVHPLQRCKGSDGHDYYKFVFNYPFNDTSYDVEFWARNLDEAKERLAEIKSSATLIEGVVVDEVDV